MRKYSKFEIVNSNSNIIDKIASFRIDKKNIKLFYRGENVTITLDGIYSFVIEMQHDALYSMTYMQLVSLLQYDDDITMFLIKNKIKIAKSIEEFIVEIIKENGL